MTIDGEALTPEERDAALELFVSIVRLAMERIAGDDATIWEAYGIAVRAALEDGRYLTTTPAVRRRVRQDLTTPTARDHGGDVALDRQRVIQRELNPGATAEWVEEVALEAIGKVLIPADQYDALLMEYGWGR